MRWSPVFLLLAAGECESGDPWDCFGMTAVDADSCIYATLVDEDPLKAGVQASCTRVWDAQHTSTPPECGVPVMPPCWQIVEDAVTCPQSQHLRIEILQPDGGIAPAEQVDCHQVDCSDN